MFTIHTKSLEEIKNQLNGCNFIIDSWYGRLGNNISQISNALFLAKFFKGKLTIAKEHSYIKNITKDYSEGNHCTNDIKSHFFSGFSGPQINDRVIDCLVDFWKKDVKNCFVESKEFLKISNENFVPLDDDHLVIYLRGGDVFQHPYPVNYFQNPPSHFIKIAKSYKKITIVHEDFLNPSIGALQEKFPHATLRSTSPLEDYLFLASSKTIAISGVGTFGETSILSSDVVKNIYMTRLPNSWGPIIDLYHNVNYLELPSNYCDGAWNPHHSHFK